MRRTIFANDAGVVFLDLSESTATHATAHLAMEIAENVTSDEDAAALRGAMHAVAEMWKCRLIITPDGGA